MVFLTRRYRFSASHRLHNEALSAEENARLYGKCNNLYGHGHNYALEVTVGGPVNPMTGMVMDLTVLDRAVDAEVLDPFGHANLNLDVESFRRVVPTTENLASEIFGRLRRRIEGAGGIRVHLEKVRLEETNSNFFEVQREQIAPRSSQGEKRNR